MLKKVIKLKPEQYEKLYQGEVVLSPSGQSIQLNLTNFNLIINNTDTVIKTEYIIEIFDKYLSKQDASDMLSLSIINDLQPEPEEKLLTANTDILATIDGQYIIVQGE